MSYPYKRKASALKKMLPPNNQTIKAITQTDADGVLAGVVIAG